MDELSDEERPWLLCSSRIQFFLATKLQCCEHLPVNLVHTYRLQKLFVVLKKSWTENMTIFLKMPSVVLIKIEDDCQSWKKWDSKKRWKMSQMNVQIVTPMDCLWSSCRICIQVKTIDGEFRGFTSSSTNTIAVLVVDHKGSSSTMTVYWLIAVNGDYRR